MEELTSVLNNQFKNLLRSSKNPQEHIFFESHKWWKNALESWSKDKTPDGIIDYSSLPTDDKIISEMECKYNTEKIITKEELQAMYEVLMSATSFQDVRTQLSRLYNYNLPSNIRDPRIHFKKNEFNILIIGAGPIGLFTSLYLDKVLGESCKGISWNILVIDNRIQSEGIKKPYTRLTQFGFDIRELQFLIPNIMSWKERSSSSRRHFDYINMLENILYVIAYKYEIPMYFTKDFENYDDVIKFAMTSEVNTILDCTGGRLRKNVPNTLSWDNFILQKENMEIRFNPEQNIFQLYEDGSPYHNITLVLRLLNENKEELSIGNMFGHPTEDSDIRIIKQISGKCFTKLDYTKISRKFTERSIRLLLPSILFNSGHTEENIAYIYVSSFDTSPYHSPSCSEKIGTSCIYIGLGNTLGLSEFGIHFGLRTSMIFSKQVVHHLTGFAINEFEKKN